MAGEAEIGDIGLQGRSAEKGSMGCELRVAHQEKQSAWAWNVVGLILHLGRPASPQELVKLSNADLTPDEIKSLCTLPGAPICISGQGNVELVKEQVKSRCDSCGRTGRGLVSSALLPAHTGLQNLNKENDACEKRTTEIPRSGAEVLQPAAAACPGPRSSAVKVATDESNISTQSACPVLSRYVVEGEGNTGGYGTVYKIRRKSDGVFFAMKCPLDKTADSYIKNEIDMLQRFRGKSYIVQCESVVLDDRKRANIVMEYFPHDKPEVLKKEITVSELRSYAFCLFKALTCLHEARVMHRDIKPANFLFSRASNVGCLIDFNLALDQSRIIPARQPLRTLSKAVIHRKASTSTPACEGERRPKRCLEESSRPCKRMRETETVSGDAAASCARKRGEGCSTLFAERGQGGPVGEDGGKLLPPAKHSRKRTSEPKDGPFAGTKGYRAPEVLLRSLHQCTKVDVWSAGVTLINLVAGRNIFPASNTEQALRDIAKLKGPQSIIKLASDHGRRLPEELAKVKYRRYSLAETCMRISKKAEEVKRRWPPSLLDLLEKCLETDPRVRIDARSALEHEFFSEGRSGSSSSGSEAGS